MNDYLTPDELISQEQWAEIIDRFVRKVGEQAGEDEKVSVFVGDWENGNGCHGVVCLLMG